MIAGEHDCGFMIKGPEQLAFRAIPYAGAYSADVGNGEKKEELETLRALHQGSEIEHGLEVVEIAHLGGFAHHQVVTNEPGDCFGFGRRHAKTRADVCGDLLPGDRMALVAALGDIVKK